MSKFEQPGSSFDHSPSVEQFPTRNSPVREQIQWQRDRLPIIREYRALSLDQLLEREGQSQEEFTQATEEMIRVLAADEDLCFGGRNEYMPQIERLYQLHALSHSGEQRLGEWLRAFANRDSFTQAFLPDADSNRLRAFSTQVQFFVERHMNAPQLLAAPAIQENSYGFQLRTYFPDQEWKLVPAPSYYDGETFHFSTREVIEEVVELLKQPYPHPDFTHSTGSEALNGIAENTALLSSQKLFEKGGSIRTGEVGRGKHAHRLGNVYADRGAPRFGYQTMDWFDEFPVVFGINQKRLDDFLNESYPDLPTRELGESGETTRTRDWGGEGMLLGPEVPLSCVTILYCHRRNMDQVRAWKDRNAPSAKLVSLEATELLGYQGKGVQRWAEEEGREPEEIWMELLNG